MTAGASDAGGRSPAAAWHRHRFARFVAVGVIGFLADALVLAFLVHVCRANPLLARLLSFSIAVVLTFELNRRWSFQSPTLAGYRSAFSKYLSVQGLGFSANFIVYSLLYVELRPQFDSPVLCLALASMAALLINYFGANYLVFPRR